MAVRAEERCSRHAEALEVDLVTYAVAGTGKIYTVFFRYGCDEVVIVSVFASRLQSVMIYVSQRLFGFYAIYAHSFELKVCHGAGGILCESIIYFNRNLIAGGHRA